MEQNLAPVYSFLILSLSITLLTNLQDPHEQSSYLVALTALIKSVPQTAYVDEMPSVSLSLLVINTPERH